MKVLSFISERILDITPNTPFAFLVYLFVFTLFCVMFIFWLKRKFSSSKKETKKEITLQDLLNIASNPKSNANDLLSALMLYNQKFDVKSNQKVSLEFFKKVLIHKNRNKKLFDYFHGSILPKNIEFTKILDELEKDALNK